MQPPRRHDEALTFGTIEFYVGDMPVGDMPVRDMPVRDMPVGDRHHRTVPVPRYSYFTPCISFWISGATRNSRMPPPTSDQKPNV